MKLLAKEKGITLIALIITIIVLLILAGVTIATLVGEDGIISKAAKAEFDTEYAKVKEGVDLNLIEQEIDRRTASKKNKLATTVSTEELKIADNEEIEQNTGIKYPVTEEKVENSKIVTTLEETIKYLENITELTDENVELYKVDTEKLKVEVKREYVINIKSGELYSLNGVKYKGRVYHRPEYGVDKNGEIIEDPDVNKDTDDIKYLKIDETKKMTPVNITGNDLEWVTGDETVAQVDSQGNVTGIAKGETIVTLRHKIVETEDEETTEENEEEKQEFKIIVEDGIPDEFSLTMEDKEIYEYDTEKMEVKIDGKKVATSYIDFTSSDENKAIINNKGEITGIEAGQVQITATWKTDNTKTVTANVTVKVNTELAIDKTQINVTINQNIQLSAKFQEQNVTNTATWESENSEIATVSKGKVTGKAVGTTKIKVTYQDLTKYCQVTVKDLVTEIYTIEDLSLLQTQVSGGANFVDQTVTLVNNLDFKDSKSYESTQSDEYTKYYMNYTNDIYDTTSSWTTIGNSTKYFKGTFNGNGKKISNLYINATTAYQGLFGYSNGGTFKNINLDGTNITSTKNDVGSILGKGLAVTIDNCNNNGTISTSKYNVGGIIGWVNNTSSISKCSNRGSVTGTGYNGTSYYYGTVGGIAGTISTTGTSTIKNCINYSEINGKHRYVGGIVGLFRCVNGTIENCINEGNVTCNGVNAGGIAGQLGWYVAGSTKRKGTIDNCINKGIISSTSYVTGGIVGNTVYGDIVQNSKNYGSVSNTGKNSDSIAYCGGIVGNTSCHGDNIIQNCINYGMISSEYYDCGGIVGWFQLGTISNCINQGSVTGVRRSVGGIAGYLGRNDSTAKTKGTIENCTNKGNVLISGEGTSAAGRIGGIAGIAVNGSTITKSSNLGNIETKGCDSSTYGAAIGGIVGYSNSNTSYCYNTGNITASYIGIGGITGTMADTSAVIKNSYSRGIIKGPTGIEKIGGILGYKYKAGEITDCYYLQNTIKDLNDIAQDVITEEGTSTTQTEIDKLIKELNI